MAARLCPGCNTRGKMILLINILSFRNQDILLEWYNREGIPEVSRKPTEGECGGQSYQVQVRGSFRREGTGW